jgi:hypothetical protein
VGRSDAPALSEGRIFRSRHSMRLSRMVLSVSNEAKLKAGETPAACNAESSFEITGPGCTAEGTNADARGYHSVIPPLRKTHGQIHRLFMIGVEIDDWGFEPLQGDQTTLGPPGERACGDNARARPTPVINKCWQVWTRQRIPFHRHAIASLKGSKRAPFVNDKALLTVTISCRQWHSGRRCRRRSGSCVLVAFS